MRGRVSCAAALVAVMGLFLPGCLWSADESLGRICASPAEGGEYCVPSTWDPAGAWGDAKAHGSLPIQMWAEWPKETTIEELSGSRERLKEWFKDIEKVTSYVRDTQGSAESYRAGMDGRMGQLLREVRSYQNGWLAEEPVDAIENFKGALAMSADAVKDPLIAEIALDKASMDAVQKILDTAEGELTPLAADYANLVKDFSNYRATETAERDAYKELAEQASKSSIDELDPIEQTIFKTAQQSSAKPNDLTLAAFKLSAALHPFALASREKLDPHADFMSEHGASMPDMTSGALRSINAMLGYVQKRVARSDATAKGLIVGVSMRRKALEMLASPPMARQQIAEAKLARAGALFAEGSKERIAVIDTAPPMNLTLQLPYLAKRYDALTALLQMKPLCDPSSSSWREAGCVSLRTRLDMAGASLKTTFPSQIAAGIATMKAKGVNAALLDRAKAKLDAGDIKGAAVLHDAALRSTEGT